MLKTCYTIWLKDATWRKHPVVDQRCITRGYKFFRL